MTSQFTTENLPRLTEKQAAEIYRQGEEAVVWALLQLGAMARNTSQPDPATPSAMVAPYAKANSKRKRKRRPGRKAGHEGRRREAPTRIDQRVSHSLDVCPDCGGRVTTPRAKRTRVVEDIHETQAVTTEHTIASHYCPRCKRRVEPKVADAMPNASIGNRTVALTSWLHYGLGNTVSQVRQVLNSLFQLPVSDGGLTQMWARAAKALEPWYAQIADEARAGAVLHADETGWRVNGRTHWLWCFTHPTLTYYVIDPSRGGKVLLEFFGQHFAGTLISDFFSAYNCVEANRRQTCLVHLLRELKKVSQRNESDEWIVFAATLERLIADALRLGARQNRAAKDYQSKRGRIAKRLDDLCEGIYEDPDFARIAKRLRKYRSALLTFLDEPDVPADNNRAEREIRPAVIARKNSYHNMSDRGARTQSILMSVYRTLKLRRHDPIETIAQALAAHSMGKPIPPLPAPRAP